MSDERLERATKIILRLGEERDAARADADRLAAALHAGRDKWMSVDEYAYDTEPVFPYIEDALAAHDAEVANR